jgi:BRCA1-associated protein
MPSFFFHLVFELYEQSDKYHLNFEEQGNIYIPPPGFNIFSSSLPHHHHPGNSDRVSGISSRSRRETVRSKSLGEDQGQSNLLSSGQSSHQALGDNSHKSNFLGPFSSEIVHRSALKSIPRNANTAKDWRFDRISIESIDMAAISAASDDKGRRKATDYMDNGTGAGLATKGKFIPSDPKDTEVGWGIVHLYRDAEETPGLYDDVVEGSHGGPDMAASAIIIPATATAGWKEEDCTTLCILAVPSYLTPSDFLGFIGEQTKEQVTHIRMIRTGRINRYMVLMKFRQAKMARDWRRGWNGKIFNSTEVCSKSSRLQPC